MDTTGLTLLVLAPSIVHAAVTISLMVSMAAEGGVTSLAGDLVRVAVTIFAWALGSWLAVCSAVELLQLRVLRTRRRQGAESAA